MDPMLLTVFAVVMLVPFALLTLAIAAGTWQVVSPPGPWLADLVHNERDPDAELPRMRSLAGALSASWAAFILVGGSVLVWSLIEVPGDVSLPTLAIAPPAALAAGLVAVLLWPSRPAADATPTASGPVRLALSDAVRRTLLAMGITLVAGLLLAGWLGVTDPVTGLDLAIGIPSVVDWRTRGAGEVVNVEWTAGGITKPWPGWAWGLPLLTGFAVCGGLASSVVAHLTRRTGPLASTVDEVDLATRRHVGLFLAILVGASLAGALGGTLLLAGTALQAISVYPLPSPDGLYANQLPGYRQPLHFFASTLVWLGFGLAAACTVIPWWGAMVVRELRRAQRAARTVF